jgi:hypothetical protein
MTRITSNRSQRVGTGRARRAPRSKAVSSRPESKKQRPVRTSSADTVDGEGSSDAGHRPTGDSSRRADQPNEVESPRQAVLHLKRFCTGRFRKTARGGPNIKHHWEIRPAHACSKSVCGVCVKCNLKYSDNTGVRR